MALAAAYGSGGGDTTAIEADITALQAINNLDYSTTEQDTGLRWLGDETIFIKTIDLGTLPNATVKSVAHGITNIGHVIDMQVMTKTAAGTFDAPMPFVQTGGIDAVDGINITRTGDNIDIQPGSIDRSTLSGICIITYIKTS